jgi:cellulose synthase/poly-beta-1,6-N-acetylglucosamine synthase-like glycosyltransferase
MRIIPLLTASAWILSFVLTLYICYYFVFFLFSLKNQKRRKQYAPQSKFAIIIAARNEEKVIPHLIESLKMQHYPKDLFEIFVIPNNCTDNTRQAALSAGARVLNCTSVVKNKGDVLTFAFDYLMKNDEGYDAYCVFDADNLVHPAFLQQMNNALLDGAKLAQGYRDSKNPYDTTISGCYSIYYWMINRFYSRARGAVGLSALINGSGFMIKAEIIRDMNGFHTVTLTEDLEFTTQCILRGEKVWWVPEAIIFDEQPLTFLDSWKQRKRWSTGCIQGLSRYFAPLWKQAVFKKDFQCLDQIMFYLSPAIQVVYTFSLLLHAILHLLYVQYPLFPDAQLYYRMFLSVYYSYIMTFAGTLLILGLERKFNPRIVKGMIAYWLFIISWIPINVLCFFKKYTVWDEIKHTRSVRLSEITALKGKI